MFAGERNAFGQRLNVFVRLQIMFNKPFAYIVGHFNFPSPRYNTLVTENFCGHFIKALFGGAF